MRGRPTLLFIAAVVLATVAGAQTSISLPPDGENQHATVTQYLGLVKVSIDYHSPKVHNPRGGEDRRGKIYGTLVPYGLQKSLGYGTCTECPWRVGANENTTFTTSNDVLIEGQPLAAGSYGLHMIPGQDDWTIIFSKNSTSWGSFFYNPADDALRVNVKPAKSEYHEYLTFEFPERKLDRATALMRWEDLQVPFTISVDNIATVYLNTIRNELHNSPGFGWQNWNAAARYALQNKDPKDALEWSKTASGIAFPGQENFNTLITLADAQAANNMEADAAKTREKALAMGNAADVHQYARLLLQQGKKQDAFNVFQLNARKHPNEWPVNVGLARGNSAVGNYKEALKYAKLALAQAPDENNKKSLQTGIEKLEQGKDMNQ
ncbi:MAG TPA: DUF2911 domain-containing protein [Thermoanaerobaculia bacterium]|nr:DUF2911 domain-containing protein [Thermoanaerobaculia bacterium]